MTVSPNGEMYDRPSFVPSHLSWWPSEPTGKDALTVTIREANAHDLVGMRHLLAEGGYKASKKTLVRWLTQNSYTVRLVCRNTRFPIAVCVTRTFPEGTGVLFLHVSPSFAGKNLDRRLLLLAAAELPEMDTTYRVPQGNTELAERLRALGWKAAGTDRERDEYVFSRRLYPTHPVGGGEAAPPAGG